MKKLMALILFTLLFAIPVTVKAGWSGFNTGTQIAAQGCETASTGWCMWMNRSFTVAKVKLIFYDNGAITQYGNPVIFYNGAVDGSMIQDAISNTGATAAYHKSYWPATSESYESIDTIVLNEGNLRDILDTLVPGGGYNLITENVKNAIPKETLPLGSPQGYRIIVEPVFQVAANGRNGTRIGDFEMNTLRNYLGRGVLTVDSALQFGQYLRVQRDDVFQVSSSRCKNIGEYSGLREDGGIGCSIGLYAPFDAAEPPETNCKKQVNGSSCSDGYIKDPTFQCIYQEDLGAFKVAENSYCTIVCRDEVYYTYPNASGIKEVLQGGFMTIGTSTTDNIKGAVGIGQVQVRNKRACRSTGAESPIFGVMDKDKFVKDKTRLEEALPGQYNTAIRKLTLYNEVKGGNIECHQVEKECEVQNTARDCEEMCELEYKGLPAKIQNCKERCKEDAGCKSRKIEYSCSFTASNGLGISRTYPKDSYRADKVREDFVNDAKNQYLSAANTYNSTSRAYAKAIGEWNACSDSSLYNSIENDLTNANVILNYANVDKDGNVVYKYEDANLALQNFETDAVDTKLFDTSASTQEDIKDLSSTGYEAIIPSARYGTFSETGAYTQGVTLYYGYNIRWWEKSLTSTIDFELPYSGYQYKTIPDGIYKRVLPGANNYIDLGFSVMPVSLTTPRGKEYDFDLYIASLGPVLTSKFKNQIESTAAVCKYKVDCEDYIVDPGDPVKCREAITACGNNSPVGCGDIRIIYRTISLREGDLKGKYGEAFPGVSAQGRVPGDNWNDEDSVPYTETKRYKYIYHNRGVDNYRVYELDPMYDITLTPSIIKKYRAYNKQANRRTGVSLNKRNGEIGLLGYSDFVSMICDVKNTKDYTCTSSLLRGVVRYGSTNTSEADYDLMVKGCAIKEARGGYGNCGDNGIVNNQAWSMNLSKMN